jgi:hypothetical protein
MPDRHETASQLRRCQVRNDELARRLPGCGVIRLGDRVAYDFPPEQTTDFSERTCMPVPKNNDVLRLECDNKIFVIAPDRHSFPWSTLQGSIDLISHRMHGAHPPQSETLARANLTRGSNGRLVQKSHTAGRNG